MNQGIEILLEELVITFMCILFRSASVITLEPCELLCVEANYMKQLYKVKYIIPTMWLAQ